MAEQEYGPDRCKCGKKSKPGSDWCPDCLRTGNPIPTINRSLALLLRNAEDCEEVAIRRRAAGNVAAAEMWEQSAREYRERARAMRGDAA